MTLARFSTVVVTAADARQPRRHIDIHAVADSARPYIPELVHRWLPDGHRASQEWVARNPKRDDRTIGSFRVNLRTGMWADFAADGIHGGDIVSLAAYLFDLDQLEAAKGVARSLGLTL